MDQVTITLSKQDPGQLRSVPDHIECLFGGHSRPGKADILEVRQHVSTVPTATILVDAITKYQSGRPAVFRTSAGVFAGSPRVAIDPCVIWITDPAAPLERQSRRYAAARPAARGIKIKEGVMNTNTSGTSEILELSEDELDAVNGGVVGYQTGGSGDRKAGE